MIRSDNGINFVGASAELREAAKEMNHNNIQEMLQKQEIEWIFNPPAASKTKNDMYLIYGTIYLLSLNLGCVKKPRRRFLHF